MDAVEDLRAAVCSDGAPSARNLLVTVFGDTLLPRGAPAVSVRSLAGLLGSFSVNERLVRTSLTRLVNDGVLVATSIRRRSFYGIAPRVIGLFETASEQIYRPPPTTWDGRWTLVLIDGGDATPTARADLRSELTERGFGVVGPNVLASAVARPDAVAESLTDTDVARIMVLTAAAETVPGAVDERALARRAHRLDELRVHYREFNDRFAAYSPSVAAGLDPEHAFKLRTLLIAAYRRIVLHDPRLPPDLLPDNWAGAETRRIVADLYRACFDASESFVAAQVRTSDGQLAATTVTADRFCET